MNRSRNFAEHFNRNWLDYRKSVTEAGDWAAVEWTGSGAIFQDVLGREYLDCLGAYGMMDLGWSHPEIVETVKAQLNRTPMPSQELIDPLRGVLARLLSTITPGNLKYSWFAASGTEAIEASIKIAKLYTGKPASSWRSMRFTGRPWARSRLSANRCSASLWNPLRGPDLPCAVWRCRCRRAPAGDLRKSGDRDRRRAV